MHDAIAIQYVKTKRGKPIRNFEKAKCWFVNNNINRHGQLSLEEKNSNWLPEQIKGDDLLNILWLSNPEVGGVINSTDISDIGLSSLLSLTLKNGLPKVSVIKELDDNIHKYANGKISDKDILRLSTRIANKQLKNLDKINALAERGDKEEFVKRLEKEVQKQLKIEKDREGLVQKLIEKIESKSKYLDTKKDHLERKAQDFDMRMNFMSSENQNKDKEI